MKIESKYFKVLLDFMDSKDATYHIDFKGDTYISIHCIANDGRYIGELIRSAVHELKYLYVRPLRISFDSKTRESLRELSSKVKEVTIKGPNVVFGEDKHTVMSQYMNEQLPIIDDTMERIQEMTLSRNEFERVINFLQREKIEYTRLRFNVRSQSLEIHAYTKLLSFWRFSVRTSSVYFSGERFDVYFAQEESPKPPHVIDQIYDVDGLLNVTKAMKYHYAREDMMFSLSLLQDGRLLFESGNKEGTLTHRCILNRADIV